MTGLGNSRLFAMYIDIYLYHMKNECLEWKDDRNVTFGRVFL